MYARAKLGKRSRELLADDSVRILVPTMTLLEMQYLYEIGRIEGQFSDVLSYLRAKESISIVGFEATDLRFAIELETRDPFDRIILASARARACPLITRDRWMSGQYERTVW